jgi:hypothetical protein
MVWQFDNLANSWTVRVSKGGSQAPLQNGKYNCVLDENRSCNNSRSLNNARSPISTPRARIDICGPHHDVRRHVAGEKCKARE